TGHRTLTIHTTTDHTTWTHHATATLTPHPTVSDTGTGRLDGVWPPAGAVAVGIEGLYERLAEVGMVYGPAFQGLRAVWRRGEELFAEVRLPEELHVDAERFRIHPALLDAALHTSLVGGVDQVRLPFSWRGVTLHAVGATALRVRLVPDGPDSLSLNVADQDGAPVATVSSLAVRPVARQQLAAASGAAVVADALFEPAWTDAVPSPRTAAARTVVVGPDPLELGTALGAAGFGSLAEAAGAAPEVVVVPWSWPGEESRTADSAHESVVRALALLREWSADERFGSSRLVLLTRGAVAVRDEGVTDLAAAAVWGAVRSAQAEHPGRLVIADVDEPDAVREVVAAVAADGDAEEQYAVRGGQLLVPRLARLRPAAGDAEPEAPQWDPEGTVLITGGTGTLGSLVARHLVERHGVRHLLLLSRRGPDAPDAHRLRTELQALGATVTITACDTSDRTALQQTLHHIPHDHPLTAVIHTAGTLNDATLDTLTPHHITTVMQPKADTAWHLHQLTQEAKPARFVLFSAAGGVLGNGGQANYAAANAYLDALAEHRRALGLPAVSLAWGLWEEVSELTGRLDQAGLERMRRAGVLPLSSEDGLALFDHALGLNRSLVVPIRLDLRALGGGAAVRPLLRDLVREVGLPRAAVSGTVGAAGAPADAGLSLTGLTPGERAHVVQELVRRQVAMVLGYADADTIVVERGFLESGFDSLRAVELRNRLNAATGLRLPATLIFDHPTPVAVAARIDELLGAAGEPEAQGRPGPAPKTVGSFAEAGLRALEAGLAAAGLLSGTDDAAAGADRERLAARLRGLLDRLAPAGPADGAAATGSSDGPGSPGAGQDGFGDDFEGASLDDLLGIVDDELRKS
ncbi:SDR family NAD(P)-dependent oxidoreductase, partial [Streptomyces sp. NPDC015220]|uniref:SDR family NAD(P)-dependent oxidoreductase n=1 Tax=Streptomyces sp. NPDC015220 TaxID=3364947 RepID=UPI0036FB8125